MDNLLSAVVHGIGKKRKRDTGDDSDSDNDKDYNPDSSTDSDTNYQPKRTKTKSTQKTVTKTHSVKSRSSLQVTTHDKKAKVTNSRNTKSKTRSGKTKVNDRKSNSAAAGSSETKTSTCVKSEKSIAARALSSRKTKTTASMSDHKTEPLSLAPSSNTNDDSMGVNNAGTKTETTTEAGSSSKKTKTKASTSDCNAELPSSAPSNNKNDNSTGIDNAGTKTKTIIRVVDQHSLSARSSHNESSTVSLKDMPTDVLLRIVQLVAEDQGILFTMDTISQVCRCLHQFVSVESLNYKALLWQRADLSALGRRMSTAVLHSRTLPKFPGLVALNLEGWPSLRNKDVEAICNAYGKTLAEVSLGDSDHLSGNALATLTSGCRQLRSVSLSRLPSKAVSGQLLIQLTSRHATTLASLTLDTIQCEIVGFDTFLSHLTSSADCLPNLTHLRLAYLCPNRRVAICPTALSASLPALRELELVKIGQSSHLDFLPPAKFHELRHILIQELKKPYRLAVSPSSLPKLTSLCVLSCDVDFSIGSSDYFTGLSRLVLAHCSRLDDYVLTSLLETSAQLTEVDFTCSASYDMSEYHEGTIAPSQTCFSRLHLLRQLKRLNLTGTSVIMHVVRDIASHLSGTLVELNLTSCKRLPRGYKRRLIGREEIQAWLSMDPPKASDYDAYD